ncbi:MAG: hypothetical protein J2P36_37540 [Ktedonobacteraceae bacterium]|nr:hypothetical protein [Ktedonobacteraceae bacterium]
MKNGRRIPPWADPVLNHHQTPTPLGQKQRSQHAMLTPLLHTTGRSPRWREAIVLRAEAV